jgi:hypothetical protein
VVLLTLVTKPTLCWLLLCQLAVVLLLRKQQKKAPSNQDCQPASVGSQLGESTPVSVCWRGFVICACAFAGVGAFCENIHV